MQKGYEWGTQLLCRSGNDVGHGTIRWLSRALLLFVALFAPAIAQPQPADPTLVQIGSGVGRPAGLAAPRSDDRPRDPLHQLRHHHLDRPAEARARPLAAYLEPERLICLFPGWCARSACP